LDYKWIAVTVTTIGIFMVGLDARIVIIGLPQVASQLGADAEQAIWITQSYVLTTTVLLLLIGRLSDIFGRVRIYWMGFAIFTVGSALTSLGFSPLSVIIFRAIQGAGAALIFANSIAIVTDATPRRQLGLFVGINQISYRAGAILGLTLSGLILSFLDWRALFYINIPVGIFGTFWARRRLKEVAVLDKNAKIDWVGFGFFAVFLLSLMIALTISAYSSLGSATVLGLFVVSGVFVVLFGLWERRSSYPLIDFRIFKIREVTGGILAVLLNVIAWAAMLLLLSLQFQLVRNQTPLQAGISILPFEIAFLAVGPLSGTLSDRFGYSRFILTGLGLGSIGLFLLSTTDASTPYSVLAFYMALMGVSTGLFLAPNLRSVMGALPMQRRGVGSALVSLFLNIGLTVSLNFALVVMSFTAPYSLISTIVSQVGSVSVTAYQQMLFMESIKSTYFVIAIVNALAIIPSIFQINREPKDRDSISSKEPSVVTAEATALGHKIV
jgi:EmrB/QacA subfamily drug resistance transporter